MPSPRSARTKVTSRHVTPLFKREYPDCYRNVRNDPGRYRRVKSEGGRSSAAPRPAQQHSAQHGRRTALSYSGCDPQQHQNTEFRALSAGPGRARTRQPPSASAPPAGAARPLSLPPVSLPARGAHCHRAKRPTAAARRDPRGRCRLRSPSAAVRGAPPRSRARAAARPPPAPRPPRPGRPEGAGPPPRASPHHEYVCSAMAAAGGRAPRSSSAASSRAGQLRGSVAAPLRLAAQHGGGCEEGGERRGGPHPGGEGTAERAMVVAAGRGGASAAATRGRARAPAGPHGRRGGGGGGGGEGRAGGGRRLPGRARPRREPALALAHGGGGARAGVGGARHHVPTTRSRAAAARTRGKRARGRGGRLSGPAAPRPCGRAGNSERWERGGEAGSSCPRKGRAVLWS